MLVKDWSVERGVTSIIIILTNGGLAGEIRLILTNYHSFLSFNSKYFSGSQIVNKSGRKKLSNLLFFFTGLIPSINFISPLNRHYVKMRRLTGIFKSNTGHFSQNDLSDSVPVKQSRET